MWYFPILILTGGIVTVIWDLWLKQQIGKARAKWVARKRDRSAPPELVTEEADASVELTERNTSSKQDTNGVQRRHAAQRSPNPEEAPRTDGPDVDRTDVKSYAIPVPTGLTILVAFCGISHVTYICSR